jgi:hypothetical protein
LGFFPQHRLHNPNLSSLTGVDISREIKQFSILPGAGSVKQVLHHHEGALVVLKQSL